MGYFGALEDAVTGAYVEDLSVDDRGFGDGQLLRSNSDFDAGHPLLTEKDFDSDFNIDWFNVQDSLN